jgi:hypothetical protein
MSFFTLRRTPDLPVVRRRTLRARLGASIFLVAAAALGADLHYEASHTTAKSPEQVWSVLSAYDQTCDKGCKYSRPNLLVTKKLAFQQTATKYYTWSHLTHTIKDTKYFSEVTFEKKAQGHFVTSNRQLDSRDTELIKKLEDKTGLKHVPSFDSGNTRTVTVAVGDKTKVTQTVDIVVSGVLDLWVGTVRKNIALSVKTTFDNIER